MRRIRMPPWNLGRSGKYGRKGADADGGLGRLLIDECPIDAEVFKFATHPDCHNEFERAKTESSHLQQDCRR
jgi:hypothetical protein